MPAGPESLRIQEGDRKNYGPSDASRYAGVTGELGQNLSTSSFVLRILERLDAPKTIASMLGWEQAHSIASFGGIAPDAKTDIAMARNLRLLSASS